MVFWGVGVKGEKGFAQDWYKKPQSHPNHGGETHAVPGALQGVGDERETCGEVERWNGGIWCDGAGEGGWFAHVHGGVLRSDGKLLSCRSVRQKTKQNTRLPKLISWNHKKPNLKCIYIFKVKKTKITWGPDLETITDHGTMLACIKKDCLLSCLMLISWLVPC